ncbi:hypothetical protein, partial [Microbacterium sp. UBA6741]|uniref:hypothetical protein n=1 Tax=Microbacterium sp. UBA6741 TaxID=1946952 RepID=UPI0025D7A665
LWRKVFNDNLINLSDGDARKQIVKEFLENPVNKKEGWKSKDARFMRLGFQKVAKENNFNVMNVGVTPEPARSKTTKGTMNLNVKSKEKKVPPIVEELQETKKDERPMHRCSVRPETDVLERSRTPGYSSVCCDAPQWSRFVLAMPTLLHSPQNPQHQTTHYSPT